MRSGYFLLMSSELRLNTAMVPFASLCTWRCGGRQSAAAHPSGGMHALGRTWARSPSYLYSHVNFLPSNLSSTSPIAFVGFASMGFKGTPGVNLHSPISLSIPTFNSAGMTRS